MPGELAVGQKVKVKSTGETGTIRSVLICGDVTVVMDNSPWVTRYQARKVVALPESKEG